jgi:hypothetical protein
VRAGGGGGVAKIDIYIKKKERKKRRKKKTKNEKAKKGYSRCVFKKSQYTKGCGQNNKMTSII